MNLSLKRWNEVPCEAIEQIFIANPYPLYRGTALGNELMKKYMFILASENEKKETTFSFVALKENAPVVVGQLHLVDFLSNYWGFKCGVIDPLLTDQNNSEKSYEDVKILISKLLEKADKNSFEFLSINVPAENISTVRAIEECGFRYAEGFINMVGSINSFRNKFLVPGLTIREVNENDYEQISDAYSKVFFPSRFASEPRFATREALQLYVNRFIEVHQKRLGKVFVAELAGSFAGALIAIIDEKMKETIGVKTNILSGMGIIIHPRASRKGVAMALIEHRQNFYRSQGVEFVSFGANFNNTPMINGLTKFGLRYGSLDMTFHRWVR